MHSIRPDRRGLIFPHSSLFDDASRIESTQSQTAHPGPSPQASSHRRSIARRWKSYFEDYPLHWYAVRFLVGFVIGGIVAAVVIVIVVIIRFAR